MQVQPFQRLYSNLYLRLVQLWPGEEDSRLVNMVYLLMGIWGARSVQTGRIAAYVPVAAKKMRKVASTGALFGQWGGTGAAVV